MRYIILDVETTDMDPETSGIVEIAGISRDVNGDLLTYSALCNPGIPVGVEAMAVHHLQDHILTGAPAPDIALGKMIQHLLGEAEDGEEFLVVAHNAEFDRGFIAKLDSALADKSSWICTYRCAMHLWPDAPRHSNQCLRYWLGLELDLPEDLHPHRALYDVIVTEGILRRMLEMRSLSELLHLSQEPVLLRTVRFGKHKGAEWKNLPADYLRWILKQSDFDTDSRHTAMHYLRPRQSTLV